MSNDDFKLEGNRIYSLATGDLVATIDNGIVRMQQGKNAMTPRVKAFYERLPKTSPAPEDGAAAPEMTAHSSTDAVADEDDTEEANTHKLADNTLPAGDVYFGGAPAPTGTSAPAPETAPEKTSDPKILSVWDIPENELPEFSPALGTATPDFKSFVKKHHLNKAQAAELVKRLERRM